LYLKIPRGSTRIGDYSWVTRGLLGRPSVVTVGLPRGVTTARLPERFRVGGVWCRVGQV
jgi:hypothetical protein